jgi:Na+:H+ antiporter, NhaC family
MITLVGVLVSVTIHIPLVIGFLPGFIFLVFLAKIKGLSTQSIFQICLNGINRTSGVIWILFLVGFLLPSWYMAGTIDQMVAIALKVITPEHFLLLSFIISMCFSMLLGTTVGTLSSIGIPLIASAQLIDIPLEVVAGAIISGAFVGDRTSPFSSAHQLLANTVELPVHKIFRAMGLSTILAVVIGLIFYAFLDVHFVKNTDTLEQMGNIGKFTIVKFIPPVILILMVIFRIRILYAFIWSISSACMIAIFYGVKGTFMFSSLWYGIEGMGGGLVNMYLLLLFLGLAGAYNGLLEELKVVQTLLDRWLVSSHSLLGDTIKAMLATLGITLVAANQTLPIIMTGRSFLSHWSKNYSKSELARVMADSTMLFPGIVPWSVLTIMCSTIVGSTIFEYLGYAIFLWVLPIVTFFISLIRSSKENQISISTKNNET